MQMERNGFLKSFGTIWLALALVFASLIPVHASVREGSVFGGDTELCKMVYSPEFPDAYILTEKKSIPMNNGKQCSIISATVFVEEKIETIDGIAVITESRLLPKSEVKAIGEENFRDLPVVGPVFPPLPTKTATRGKLTITFTYYSELEGNGISIYLGGEAHWDGFNFFYNAENNPAAGNDFFGFTWAGGYTVTDHSFSTTWDTTPAPSDPVYYHPFPNSGAVYEFREYNHPFPFDYRCVEYADIYVALHKNTLTGSGNMAEVVLEYIHTYQDFSANPNLSWSQVPLSFSVNSVNNQWTLKTDTAAFLY